MTGPSRPETEFLRSLFDPLWARAKERIGRAIKVAYFTKLGHSSGEIMDMTSMSVGELKAARDDLAEAAREGDLPHQ
ncbi:MAG TPA: hypothetical protein VE780_10865 [Thermoleophilaceae bacterium]|jgi:hypothetical protein|nr:hypothetical protein [Thermoleophilaceae bacterium]